MSAREFRVENPSDGGFFFWLLKFFTFGASLLILLVLHGLAGVYIHFASQLPPVPTLEEMARGWPARSVIYAHEGQVLGEFAREWREPVALERMPRQLRQAFLAAEDRRFLEHGGIDLRGIARALVANLRSLSVRQGGSTISQQVAKAMLGSERTIERKIREAILARRLERRLGKDGVLYLYANLIFFGNRAYGVQAAARRYFDKDVSELDLGESALIAGLARAPSRYSPLVDPKKARERRDQVLAHMEQERYISAAERETARQKPLTIRPRPEFFRDRAPDYTEQVRRVVTEKYGEPALQEGGLRIYTAVDLQKSQLAWQAVERGLRLTDKRQGWRGPVAHLGSGGRRERFLGAAAKLYGAGLPAAAAAGSAAAERHYLGLVEKVTPRGAEVRVGEQVAELPIRHMTWAARYTRKDSTNDRTIGDARQALKEGDVIWVRPVHEPTRPGARPPAGAAAVARPLVALEQTPRLEGVLYSVNLKSGYVEALIGGRDFDESQFNRATQGCRQPGSTFKPIYYSLALDRGMSLATPLKDSPTKETTAEGQDWVPKNLHDAVYGTTTLWHALVMSLNLASIDLLVKVGYKDTVKWAQRLGFSTTLHADLGLALGASCVRPAELGHAFAVFATGGKRLRAVTIRRIVDRTGKVLEDNSVPEDPFLTADERLDRMVARAGEKTEQVIHPTTAYLTERALRDAVQRGIAWAAYKSGAPSAGKTGTSSKTMDVWFVGFTESLLSVAWVGSEHYERPIGTKDTGSSVALPIWADYMKPALGGRPQGEIPREKPKDVVFARVSLETGQPASEGPKTISLPFREGTLPVVGAGGPTGAPRLQGPILPRVLPAGGGGAPDPGVIRPTGPRPGPSSGRPPPAVLPRAPQH